MTFPTRRQWIRSAQTGGVTGKPNVWTLGSAAIAGNLLVVCLAGDKNTGTVTMTDNIGGSWTLEASVPGTSVSTYVAWKVAAGGETTLTMTTQNNPTSGNTGYAEELEDDGSGTWMVVCKAVPAYNDTSRSSAASGTTDTADWDGRALAVGTIDSVISLSNESAPTHSGYTMVNIPPRPSGSDGGNAGCFVGTTDVAQGATTSTTFSTNGGSDQLTCLIVAFGKTEPPVGSTGGIRRRRLNALLVR